MGDGGAAQGLRLTDELIEGYAARLRAKNVRASTVAVYDKRLRQLRERLDGGIITPEALARVVDELSDEGYANQTINVILSAANGLLDFAGRRDLQYAHRLRAREAARLSLTRAEYLRLLSAAKLLGKERTYLIIKCCVLLGLGIRGLTNLTAEAIRSGVLSDGGRVVPIPECLRAELESYVQSRCLTGGPVFLTEDGTPMSRTYLTSSIKRLAEPARVDAAKCSVRCLYRLWEDTQRKIERQLASLCEEAHRSLLEQEQRLVGWENGGITTTVK